MIVVKAASGNTFLNSRSFTFKAVSWLWTFQTLVSLLTLLIGNRRGYDLRWVCIFKFLHLIVSRLCAASLLLSICVCVSCDHSLWWNRKTIFAKLQKKIDTSPNSVVTVNVHPSAAKAKDNLLMQAAVCLDRCSIKSKTFLLGLTFKITIAAPALLDRGVEQHITSNTFKANLSL